MMLPRVVLIGDSIRMGYQNIAAARLAGEASVWGPTQNGGNSANVLEHLDEWVLQRPADVVHINCGLHDLRHEFGAAANVIPLAEYATNVRTILERLAQKSDAQIIWASITPVNHDWHHANKSFDRFEEDVVAYNEAANAIALALGLPVDDLYQTVMAAGRDALLREDGVHYLDAGYDILGGAVAGCIQALL